MKGWYIPARPDQLTGESTAWFASFWSFCSNYLQQRFDNDWCLSPEQSISLKVGSRTVPRQLIVRSSVGKNNITPLPQNTSILDVRTPPPLPVDIDHHDGLNIFKLPLALISCAPTFFRQNPTEARAALSTIQSGSDILGRLLESGQPIVAGRLAGAFRNIRKRKNSRRYNQDHESSWL